MDLHGGSAPAHHWWRLFGAALVVTFSFGALTLLTAAAAGLPLRDPDGLLGPSYVRLPLIAAGMMVLDVLPRVVLRRRASGGLVPAAVEVVRERCSSRRLAVVAAGLTSFYVAYVAYRNLKSFLPFLRERLTDRWLVDSDRWLALGGHPGDALHTVLGTGVSADILSVTYTFFLLFVPFSLAAALVWSTDLARGAWYVTALSFNWIIGTASYYALPSLGPIYVQPSHFTDLPDTGVTLLQNALLENRLEVLADPHATQAVHGIAAFASLHTSIVFTAALVAQLTGMPRLVKQALWVFFALTAVATVYFGWHYVVDVFAGLGVGGLSVWLGAKAVGRGSRSRTPAPERETAVAV